MSRVEGALTLVRTREREALCEGKKLLKLKDQQMEVYTYLEQVQEQSWDAENL